MNQQHRRFAARTLLITAAALTTVAPLVGCLEETREETLEGELILTPPPASLDGAVISLTLWRYDPMLADGGADRVADETIAVASEAPVPFIVADAGLPEAGFEYYITAVVDLDGDGARSDGDYYPSDFGAVDTSGGSWTFTEVNLAPVEVEEGVCMNAEEHGEAFAASLAAWREIKASSGSIYRYISEWQSWTGDRGRTVIHVESDVVTDRSYQAWDEEGALVEEWSESGDELGSHLYAAPALTLDEVYDRCCAQVLSQSLEDNTLYFGTEEATGLLETCLFVPSGCADDCDEGFRVSNLAFAVDG